MPTIPLTQDKQAIVCDCHYDLVKVFNWYTAKSRHVDYAQRMNKRKIVKMHRVISDCPKGMVVDHINGDGLDNRCTNLRVCTNEQNQHNSTKLRPTNKSGYKGVSWRDDIKKWRAVATRGKKYSLGHFELKEDAAKAYADFVTAKDGEFAFTRRTI